MRGVTTERAEELLARLQAVGLVVLSAAPAGCPVAYQRTRSLRVEAFRAEIERFIKEETGT